MNNGKLDSLKQTWRNAGQNNLAESDHAIHGGAFPLRVNGEHVGTVVVSGIPQAEDHLLAVAGLREFLARG